MCGPPREVYVFQQRRPEVTYMPLGSPATTAPEAGRRAAALLLTFLPPRVTLYACPVSHPTKEGLIMFYPTESKPQGWRALAVFDDRNDRLLYLGRSSTQVRG